MVTDFILGGWKITADGDCRHKFKRRLLLGRKVMTNLDSILKSRDVTLPTKVHLVKTMYGCKNWTIKKAEQWRIDVFALWCWRRFLRVPWTARRSNQSILKEISPEYSLEGLMLKLKLPYFGHLMQRTDSWRRKWQPTPVFLPGESQGRGAWWAAVCGVTQSQTRLKWVSSSSNMREHYVFFFWRKNILMPIHEEFQYMSLYGNHIPCLNRQHFF